MKVDIWMPLFVSDYLGDTMELTTEEHGIYLLLLLQYWKKGKLTSNFKKLQIITKTDDNNIESLDNILSEFFTLSGDRYINGRIESELNKANSRRESASSNGKKGGRPKKNNNPQETHSFNEGKPTDNPKGNPQESSSPLPSPLPLSSTLEQQKDNKDLEMTTEIISYLNDVLKTNYRPGANSTKKHILARIREGYAPENFKTVIDKKSIEWMNTDMAKFLRPETLFGTKFESYLNQKEGKQEKQDNFKRGGVNFEM